MKITLLNGSPRNGNGIIYEYGRLVEYIKNRDETRMCPLEECIQDETDPVAAWTEIENKISELMSIK